MVRSRVSSLAAALLLGIWSGAAAAQDTPQQPQQNPQLFQQFAPVTLDLCADFGLFGNGTAFPVDFTLAGTMFHDPTGLATLVARTAAGETGLGFGPVGLGVTLPAMVASVTLRIGAFGGPVTLMALDEAFATQANETVTAGNAFADVTLSGTGIRYVSIDGGGSQGNLRSVCTRLTVVGERPGGLGQGFVQGAGRGQGAGGFAGNGGGGQGNAGAAAAQP